MSDKLQEYIDDLTYARNALTKGQFVELSPGATKEILEILVLHKEVLEQLEQAQEELKQANYEIYRLKGYHEVNVSEINSLNEANKKLIEGLQWYASEGTYKTMITHDRWGPVTAIDDDRGQRAQTLLQELEQE